MGVSAVSDMYIDKTELEMYRINPAPPKWDLQEYILAYKSENDEKYLNWFCITTKTH